MLYLVTLTQLRGMDPPLPWELCVSSSHERRVFYRNTVTRESTWIRPIPYPGTSSPWPRLIAFAEIVVKHVGCGDATNPVTRTPEEALEKAEWLFDQIANAGKDFHEIARENSDGPVTKHGGWFQRGSRSNAFECVVWELENGEMSRPFETDEGVHVVLRLG